MKKLLLLIFSICSFVIGYSASTYYYSILDGGGSGGSWNNSAYWSGTSGGSPCGCWPGSNPSGSTYTYIETNMNMSISITEFGYLYISTGKSLSSTTNSLEIKSGSTLVVYGTLEVYDLTFYNGSIIDIKPGATIIVHHDFTNNNNSNNVTINGSVSVTGIFNNGTGGIVSGTGVISASDYTGSGTTFNYTNNTIPDGSAVSEGSLPVQLAYFNAQSAKGKVYLNWTTMSEVNNNYFEVQRSEDAVNFNVLTQIAGAGNSNTIIDYNYTDENVFPNAIYYYRLKQVDFNGENKISDIISVETNQMDDYFVRIGNSENYLTLLFAYPVSGEILVQIYNNMGSVVSQSKEMLSESTSFKISKSELKTGFYTLAITSGKETIVKKIINIH